MPNKYVQERRRVTVGAMRPSRSWIDEDADGGGFGDQRLAQRFRVLLERFAAHPGESIPLACQNWASAKAAYRFLDNAQVDESEILSGHFRATRDRARADATEPILILHDTIRISPHVGPRFHVMPVQHFTACRSSVSRMPVHPVSGFFPAA
jgi:hypothetical protein